ncbi:MAG: N-acetyl-alpha-D-glucosaminyl L-malate synthase BshA [Patescibacteria group bacterium]
MKIAIICYPSSGGSGIVGTSLGLELAKRGHQVHFIASEVPFKLIGPWKKNVFYHEVEQFEYPLFDTAPYSLTLANKIYNVVMQNNIQVINCHYAVPHSLSAYIAREMVERAGKKVKVVTTLHGTDVSIIGHDPIIKDAVGFTISKSDAITSVSKAMVDEAKEAYKLEEKIDVIYNFVDIKPPKKIPEDLKEVFGTNNAKIITHMSNFRAVKRIEDVIKVFEEVQKKVDSRLLLIGDGPEQRTAYKLASKRGLINKIHFLGLQSSIEKLLSISHLFLLPSEKENFSLSSLEAMSLGVPVISTRVGGMSEMIDHQKNGFLVEVGETSKMAEYAVQVLTDEREYKKISENAKKKVEENFSVGKIVPQYESLYKRLIANS